MKDVDRKILAWGVIVILGVIVPGIIVAWLSGGSPETWQVVCQTVGEQLQCLLQEVQ